MIGRSESGGPGGAAGYGRSGAQPHTAVYAGSFDPITRGHEDLMRRSLAFVDRLVVGVANNSAKKPLFEVDVRVELIRAAVGNEPRIEVRSFSGLLVDFATEVGAKLIIRGLRAVSDFEYEFQNGAHESRADHWPTRDDFHGPFARHHIYQLQYRSRGRAIRGQCERPGSPAGRRGAAQQVSQGLRRWRRLWRH